MSQKIQSARLSCVDHWRSEVLLSRLGLSLLELSNVLDSFVSFEIQISLVTVQNYVLWQQNADDDLSYQRRIISHCTLQSFKVCLSWWEECWVAECSVMLLSLQKSSLGLKQVIGRAKTSIEIGMFFPLHLFMQNKLPDLDLNFP